MSYSYKDEWRYRVNDYRENGSFDPYCAEKMLAEMYEVIAKQEDEMCDDELMIHELANENELLKAQVYNLHLYLKTMWENVTTGFNRQIASDFYDGMPGYGEWTEEILTDA